MKNEFDIFENAPILKFSKKYKFDKIKNRFFRNMKENTFEEKYILLWPFVDTKHFKYIKPEVYEKLSSFLFENMRGFSPQNIWRMKQFYETYQDSQILSTVLRELSYTSKFGTLR